MTIAQFNLYRFVLPLSRPLTVKGVTLTERSGHLIELFDEHDHSGLGEVSPLPGLSAENSATAQPQLEALRFGLIGREIPDHLEELSGGFERWLAGFDLAPSVRFGFESAVLNLCADSRSVPLRRFISDSPRDAVSINGLLSGKVDEILEKAARLSRDGYRALKLKVGHRPLQDDISLIRQVERLVGDAVAVRLDANRAWSIAEARDFFAGVKGCRIEYIEEPVHSYDALVSLSALTDFPVALDESLQDMKPEQLQPLMNLKAIVVKPTLLGLEKSMLFARRAAGFGIATVVSSSFESSLGLSALAELAACLNTDDTPVGLDTLDRFAEDLLVNPLQVEHGRLKLSRSSLHLNGLRHKLLEEIKGA
ncbi:MAG TPA: o-succinylbenzoate synthase [Candidatus Deferrimicrobium sp.]|nr:o-succinylbenzoate synthase [Candidatus Deferrimicrobium sp.]